MLLKKRFSCEQQQLGAILVRGRVLKAGSTTRTAEKVRWRFSCLFVCLCVVFVGPARKRTTPLPTLRHDFFCCCSEQAVHCPGGLIGVSI